MKARLGYVAAAVLAASACSSQPPETGGARGEGRAPLARAELPVTPGHAVVGAMNDAATRARFASEPDRGSLVRYPEARTVRRDGAYTWHRADFSESHARSAIGGLLSFTTPAGELLRFRYERHVEHASGDWTWVGSIVGKAAEEAIITFGSKAAFGTIAQPGKAPLRLTIANGASWLIETDPREIAKLKDVGARPTEPDFLVAPELAAHLGDRVRTAGDSPLMAGAATASADAKAATTVDVVLGYTPGFVSYYGGESQAITRLNNMVDITNEAYLNSQIDATVRLVRTVAVSYTDTNSNKTALEELTGYQNSQQTSPAAVFSQLRAARDESGADLVSLVRRFNTPENEGCGIAWLLGGGRRGSISTSSEYFGYSVVSDGRDAGTDGKTYFCRDETLAHELGHNMGAGHDRDTSDGDDNVLQQSEYGVFDYSFGYKAASSAGNFYTVMAYGDSGQTRYRVFSNPRITYCGGLACGVANEADNARGISQTIPTIASFRATVVAAPPTPSPAAVKPTAIARDVDGDRKADLQWFNPATRELYYWLMNGGAIRYGVPAGSAPAGASNLGVGDFNGDGRSDVVLASANDIWIYMATPWGGYQSTYVAPFPAGWTIGGFRDFNADGKGDFLWFNAGSGQLYTWFMDGGAIRSGQGVGAPPSASPRALGDFNADGRADIVLASEQDIWIYLGNAQAGFVSGYVATYPAGWNLVGAADMNADGRADFAWHHPTTGEIYAWIMQGSGIQFGRGGVAAPTGTVPRAIGDFNADGAADIVFNNATDIWTYLGKPQGGFTSAYTHAFPAGWVGTE